MEQAGAQPVDKTNKYGRKVITIGFYACLKTDDGKDGNKYGRKFVSRPDAIAGNNESKDVAKANDTNDIDKGDGANNPTGNPGGWFKWLFNPEGNSPQYKDVIKFKAWHEGYHAFWLVS